MFLGPIAGPSVRRFEFQCDFAVVFLLVKHGSFVSNIDMIIRGNIYAIKDICKIT